MTRRQLVVVGAGHAHLDLLAALSRNPLPRGSVTMVTPDADFHYSGLLPGILAGDVEPSTATIPVTRIATAAGVTVHHTAATGLDLSSRVVHLANGDVVPFDVLSLDVGSEPSALDVPGAANHAFPMRPFQAAMKLAARLQSVIADAQRGAIPSVVVGAGAAGVEIAFAIAARIRRHGHTPRVTLVDPAMTDGLPLPGFMASSRRLAARALAERGIALCSARVLEVQADGVHVDDAASGRCVLPSVATAWVTGPAAPPWFVGSGLACDTQGYALADARLALDAAATIFGGGDCVTLREHPHTPKAGVFAVRMAPVLAANVLAVARGRAPMRDYTPQRTFLALLSTGDGAALLRWRGVAFESRAAQWLKTRIDQSYLKRYAGLAR